MDRTKRAALLAAVIVAGTIGGLGGFLGFPVVGSIVAGIVLGCLAGLLLIAAGRRAETFHPTAPTTDLIDPADEHDQRPDDTHGA
ncbi:MAG: hypothetical protein LC679_18125 [Intrasporangiaceae bacterium]|nr:hypothetical protein [Intrasporangiaceae bacterium]